MSPTQVPPTPPPSGAEKQGVKVYVRVRPMSTMEKEQGCANAFVPEDAAITLGPKKYTFDQVFDGSMSQKNVFNKSAATLLDGFFEGYNATVFAYGQTGSGKTYTMGVDHGGVIPQVVDEIFARGKELEDKMTNIVLKMSYLEIFNEEVFDLLAGTPTSLAVRDDVKGGVVVTGLSKHQVNSTEEVKQLLTQGAARRATASTGMNDTSSRSHAICTLSMHQQPAEDSAKFSKFHLVDLAGSERAKRTMATGERFKEGVHINQALLTLGKVITSLSDKKSFVPYRESKLTRLLQDSLGGNSKTVMIACVSPADSNFEETSSTLRYAERARAIQNKAVINKDPGACEIKYLRQQVELLQLQLLQQKALTTTKDGSENTSMTEELDRVKHEVELLRKAKEQWKKIAQDQNGDELALNKAFEMDMQVDVVSMNATDLANIEREIEEKEAIMAVLNSVDEKQFGAELHTLEAKYEAQIASLQSPSKTNQLAIVINAQKECMRLQKLHKQGQLKISALEQELTHMKQLKASLQRQLKTEVGNAQKEQRRQSLEILKLQRKDAKKQMELQKLTQLHSQQTNVLKRKNEELAKLQASKRFKPNEPAITTETSAQVVDEVLEVEMTIHGAKAAIKVEIEERMQLAKTIRKTPPGPAKQKLEQKMQEKNADIRKLQQKLDLVEKNHRSTSKLCNSNVSTCHKIIHRLLETAVTSKKRCIDLENVERQLLDTEAKLVDRSAKLNELNAEVKRLNQELSTRPPKKIVRKKRQEDEVEELPSESDEEDIGEYDDDSDYTEETRRGSGRKEKTRTSVETPSDCCLCKTGKCGTKACACRARGGHCSAKCSCQSHKCINRGDMDVLTELCGPNASSIPVFESPNAAKTSRVIADSASNNDKENAVSRVLSPSSTMVVPAKKVRLTKGLQASSMRKLYTPPTPTSQSLIARLKTL
ncbi:unnamed protein product [Aphanomyces euteiches]